MQTIWQNGPMTNPRADQQRALYGSTLAERFGAVMNTYALTQRGLADVLGLSAPMLSQLIHAQRIKIGNPAVYERLVMLEVRADEDDHAAVLAEVHASTPVLSTQQSTTMPTTAELSSLATPDQLRATAEFAQSLGATRLASALLKSSQASN